MVPELRAGIPQGTSAQVSLVAGVATLLWPGVTAVNGVVCPQWPGYAAG